MEINLQGKYAHIANMMLKQLRTKEITLNEFLIQCAYWGVKTMDDIYFRPLPSKPTEVINYEGWSYSEREKLTWEYYADHPEVNRYYEERGKIKRENKNSLWRLQEIIKKHIPESDVKNHEKLDKKIFDLKMKMEGY